MSEIWDGKKPSQKLAVDANGAASVKQNATKAAAVTPHDTNDLTGGATKGLYIGGAGNVALIMQDGSEAIFTAMAVGVIHNLSVKRIKATGTTATSIIALY